MPVCLKSLLSAIERTNYQRQISLRVATGLVDQNKTAAAVGGESEHKLSVRRIRSNFRQQEWIARHAFRESKDRQHNATSEHSRAAAQCEWQAGRLSTAKAAFPHPHKTAEDGNTRLPS
jgi:hypothetical protein